MTINDEELSKLKMTLYRAISNQNILEIQQLFQEFRELPLLYDNDVSRHSDPSLAHKNSLICDAMYDAKVEIVQFLLDRGVNVDTTDANGWSALGRSIVKGRKDIAELLLEHGADPNIGNPLRVVNGRPEADAIGLAKLLLDHGADPNQVDIIGDDTEVTALDWLGNDEKLAKYLISRGAKTLAQLRGFDEQPMKLSSSDLRSKLIAHFNANYGKVDPLSVVEIVGEPSGIEVFFIPAGSKVGMFGGKSEHHVLFTFGLSKYRMLTPSGDEEFQSAELMMFLDPHWPAPKLALGDPTWAWPILWLRQMAEYPIKNKTWLGGPYTVIPNGLPPEPLAPSCPYSAWLLTEEERIKKIKPDGENSLVLFRVYPLFKEEYELSQAKPLADLFEAFARNQLSIAVQPTRRNVATK